MAAFHSRTHKHADHATFVWSDRGAPILVDAGRYGYVGRTEEGSELRQKGYWYSDPNRIYVESTRAHNTVEIDGEDHPRVGVKPFGSFLKSGEQQGPLVVTETDGFYDEAKQRRHRRFLVFKPGEFLLVIDRVTDHVPHSYVQRFTFHPRWEVVLDGGQVRASTEGGTPPILAQSLLAEAAPISVARGVKEPRMQGWHSDRDGSMIPASSIGFEEKEAAIGRFVTLFTFGEKLEADATEQQVEGDLTELTLRWKIDGREREVKVSAPEGESLKAVLIK